MGEIVVARIDYQQSLTKAEVSATATTRWGGFLRILGYAAFFITLAVAVIAFIVGLAMLGSSDGPAAGGSLILGSIAVAIYGAVVAAPLLAVSSYLTMGAHRALADIELQRMNLPVQARTTSTNLAPTTDLQEIPVETQAQSTQSSTTAAPARIPADFYPDPEDATQMRFWDGSQWTDQKRARG